MAFRHNKPLPADAAMPWFSGVRWVFAAPAVRPDFSGLMEVGCVSGLPATKIDEYR
jgi:hypothetical protein